MECSPTERSEGGSEQVNVYIFVLYVHVLFADLQVIRVCVTIIWLSGKAPQGTANEAKRVGLYEVKCTVLHLYYNSTL